jgi:hypothetical protein
MDGKIDVSITFDDNNQIRVLSADKFRETENLKGECIDFLKSKWLSLGPFIFHNKCAS